MCSSNRRWQDTVIKVDVPARRRSSPFKWLAARTVPNRNPYQEPTPLSTVYAGAGTKDLAIPLPPAW